MFGEKSKPVLQEANNASQAVLAFQHNANGINKVSVVIDKENI